MIIAVGFKVNSERAVQFRKWVNQIAKDYTIKGWVMDDERLKRGTYLTENIIGKEIHLSTAVFGNRTILLAYIGTVAKKTCEDLVYYYLLIAHILFRGYHEH